MHLNAKYLRNESGYLKYGKSRIEMNVWCIWINEIFSIQLSSRTKIWYNRWHDIFSIVCIILEQNISIAVQNLLRYDFTSECYLRVHASLYDVQPDYNSLYRAAFTTRARTLNKAVKECIQSASPMRDRNDSSRSYHYREQRPAEMISVAPQQRYLTFSVGSRAGGGSGYHETTL